MQKNLDRYPLNPRQSFDGIVLECKLTTCDSFHHHLEKARESWPFHSAPVTPCVAGVWQGLQHHDQRVLQREVEGPATPGQQGLQQGGTSPRGSFVCFLSDMWSCFDVAMFPRAVLCSVAIIVCLRPLLQRAHKGPIPYKFLRKRLATYFLRIFTHSIFCQISSS